MATILLKNNTRYKFSRPFFQKILKKAEKGFPELKNQTISLVLLGQKKIQQLNKKHRGKDRPTDTISFAFREGAPVPGETLLGEIFLCPDYISQQARRLQKPFRTEMRWIFVHSLLHLLGFDHKNEAEEAEMNDRAREILKIDKVRSPHILKSW